ncbi:hypothetical protein [uncultured Tateyamaria sp.]|uniref:hypothetical protein n=1 Tax=uncultured Tateyamaria sp. TaxID=455651 RepID=UPI0026159CE8|nr:hypothetical protein [uncultured Tateyamaria sp.]
MSAGANTSGLRATANGQMVKDLAIRSEIDNMVPLPVNMARMTIQVEAPAQYAGEYTTQSNVLDTRPTRLVRPQIAYDEEAGALHMVAPGLWAHDDRIAPPNLTYRWRRDGKGISGAVDTTYVLQPEDYGRPIQLRERGTDANGRRAHLSVAITVPPPSPFEVVLEADGTLRIDGNDGRAFEVEQASDYAGRYSVSPAALVAGPVVLVPPQLAVPATAAPGEALAITPALFAYDPELGEPVIRYSAGVDASDPANPVYVVQTGDQGEAVTITATAVQGTFAADSVSNGVSIPAAPPPPDRFEVVLEADGTLRIDGNDGRAFEVEQASDAYVGSYRVLPSELEAGPVALVPPQLVVPDSALPGDALAITPALFAYDPDLGEPVIRYSSGVDASDPISPFYVIQAGDQGAAVVITATAVQGALATNSVSNSVNIPAAPSAPDLFEIVLEADGTLRIDGNDGRTFQVEQASEAYAGTYRVSPAELEAGPVALVPPQLEVPAAAVPGDVLTITPPLFAYDPDLGVPVIRYSAGVDASDPDAPVYVIQSGEQGTNFSVAVTASQGGLDTASRSNEITVP